MLPIDPVPPPPAPPPPPPSPSPPSFTPDSSSSSASSTYPTSNSTRYNGTSLDRGICVYGSVGGCAHPSSSLMRRSSSDTSQHLCTNNRYTSWVMGAQRVQVSSRSCVGGLLASHIGQRGDSTSGCTNGRGEAEESCLSASPGPTSSKTLYCEKGGGVSAREQYTQMRWELGVVW